MLALKYLFTKVFDELIVFTSIFHKELHCALQSQCFINLTNASLVYSFIKCYASFYHIIFTNYSLKF